MAGEARTDNFMLGTATLMIGPMANLMALGKADSVGLVKNIMVKTEPTSVDLTQGVRNSLVYTMLTGNPLSITGEVYEYTLKNLVYSASLDGSALTAFTAAATTVNAAYAAPVGPAILGAVTLTVLLATGINAGDDIVVQGPERDQVFVRRVISLAANVLTLNYGLPIAIGVGAAVTKVQQSTVGAQDQPPFLAAKLFGELANGKAINLLIPKVKIVSGLSLGFQTDNYQNMAWELKAFDQLATDPFYADFATASPQGRPALAKLWS